MTQPDATFWTKLSDAELLEEFAVRRRQEAFAQIVQRHGGMVLAVCRSVLGTTYDAEDAAQAVFLTLAQKASSRHVQSHLVGWLHKVAWFVAARAATAQAIRRRHEQEAARMRQENNPLAEEPIPLEQLHAGLADLPEKYRVPLLLHHLEGHTQQETAALLGCQTSAIGVRLHRGRQMLRERLAKHGVETSEANLQTVLDTPTTARASPIFVSSITAAAMALVAGQVATTASISATSLVLSKGAMNMLFWAKVKLIGTVVAAILLVSGLVGTVLVAHAAGTTETTGITGTISQVDSNKLTLQTKTASIGVELTDATVVKVDGKVATAASLKVGMSAIVFAPSGQPATEIRAYKPQPAPTQPAPPPSVAGTITQIGENTITIQTKTGDAVVVPLNYATVVKVMAKIVTPADLKVGMTAVAIVTSGQPATEIRAYQPTTQPAPTQPAPTPASISGTITQISDNTITLQAKGGSTVAVTFNSSTVVKVLGKVATAADLKVGMTAIAIAVTGQPATEIRAYPISTTQPAPTQPAPTPTAYVSGTITQVADGSITIQPKTGSGVVVSINSATVVKIMGKVAAVSDLKVGMAAAALGATGQPATEIRAYPPTNTTQNAPQTIVVGAITQLGSNSITIQPQTGQPVTVAVNSSTVYKIYNTPGGTSASVADLKVGMRCMATVQAGKPATEIKAYMPKTTNAK